MKSNKSDPFSRSVIKSRQRPKVDLTSFFILSKKPPCIGEVVIWIAKLGGYLARKNDGPPGTITLLRGWKRLTDLTEGWALAAQA